MRPAVLFENNSSGTLFISLCILQSYLTNTKQDQIKMLPTRAESVQGRPRREVGEASLVIHYLYKK